MKATHSFLYPSPPSPHRKLSACHSTRVIKPLTLSERPQLQKSLITLPSQQLTTQQSLYTWRINTQFPVVKVNNYRLLHNNQQTAIMEIQHEQLPLLLIELKDVPLFKIIYLLKESLIGYERLFHRFGSFLVTPRMIGINPQQKCKVWVNQNLALNSFQANQLNQQIFLQQIFRIFEHRCNSLHSSRQFFKLLGNCKTFSIALNLIEQYVREYRIAVTTCFKDPKLNSGSGNERCCSFFDPCMTMGRSPKFVSSRQIRNSLNVNANLEDILGRKKLKSIQKNNQCNLNNVSCRGTKSTDYHDKTAMKKSGETADQVKTSKTMSYFDGVNEQHQIHKNVSSKNEKVTSNMQQSQFLQFRPKNQRHSRLTRKPSKEIFSCLTPQPARYNQLKTHNSQWDMNHFLQPSQLKDDHLIYKESSKKQAHPDLEEISDNDSAIDQKEMHDLFQKNHWQNKIQNLFDNSAGLKQSFHQGKQPIWKEQQVLPLLGNFSKLVYESMTQNDRSKDLSPTL